MTTPNLQEVFRSKVDGFVLPIEYRLIHADGSTVWNSDPELSGDVSDCIGLELINGNSELIATLIFDEDDDNALVLDVAVKL